MPLGRLANAHHRHLHHFRIFVQHLLHIAGEDGELAKNNGVFFAADDAKIAIFILHSHIPRIEPAIIQHNRIVERAIGLPVALHDLRAANDQLANLADGHVGGRDQIDNFGIGVGDGHANRTRFAQAVERVGVGNGRRFGEAVPFDETAVAQLLKRLLHLDGQRRRPADARFDRREPIFAHPRRLVDGHVHHRHAGEHGHVVIADVFENLLRLENGQEDNRAAKGDGHAHGANQAVTVQERHGR